MPILLRQLPFALVGIFADHARTHVVAPIIKLLLELVFDELALFLDHQNFVETFGEMPHALGVEGPVHADLVDTQPDFGGARRVDFEIVERLSHVKIGFSRRDDAEPRFRAVDDDAVEMIRPRISHGGVNLEMLQAHFLIQRGVGPADIEAARRQDEILGDHALDAEGVERDIGRAFDRVGGRLERHPAARIARHGPAVQAEIDIFLHVGGI